MPKRKKNKGRKKNSHYEEGAVALHFDDGTRRVYAVLNVEATIVAVLEEDRRGWGTLADAGYGECPVYGPMEVEPVVIERLQNVPKREREAVGQIMAGLLGKQLGPYLPKAWGRGDNPSSAHRSVETKTQGRYDAPLRATLGDVMQTKRKLLKK